MVVAYWLTPVRSVKQTAKEVIQMLVGQEQLFAFGEHVKGRMHLKQGDQICFYASGIGVVAHAEVASGPERKSNLPLAPLLERYPWVIRLDKVSLYLEEPIAIDSVTRSYLEAFQGRNPNANWAWLVQSTRKLTQHDFRLLTRRPA